MITGYAATKPGGTLEPFTFDPGPLGDNQVEIKVEYCGLCHSDLSMVGQRVGNQYNIPWFPDTRLSVRSRAWAPRPRD